MSLLCNSIIAERNEHQFGIILLYIITDDITIGNNNHSGICTLLDNSVCINAIGHESMKENGSKITFKGCSHGDISIIKMLLRLDINGSSDIDL